MEHANPQVSGWTTVCRVLAAVFALALSVVATNAQGLDRIERERAQTMLGVIKDEIKKNYYDPSFRDIDIDARFRPPTRN